jgi:hypothetical protein
MPGCFVFTAVHSQTLFFRPDEGLEFIELSRFWNLVILIGNCRFCLAHPVDDAVMVNARDSFNRPKPHAIERHLHTQVFDISAIALRGWVLPKLALAVPAEIALFTVAVSVLHDVVTRAARAVHGLVSHHHSLACNTRFSICQDNGKKGEVYGFDGGKKVKGRKRHIVVDSQGLLIGVLVSEANASERLGAIVVLDEAKEKLSKLEVVWVDQGYSGKKFAHAVKQMCGEHVRVDVIERTSSTFEHLPKQ